MIVVDIIEHRRERDTHTEGEQEAEQGEFGF